MTSWRMSFLAAAALALVACPKDEAPASETPAAASPATTADTAPAATPTPAPTTSAPSVEPGEARSLDPEHPYTKTLWDRVQELVGQDCSSGATESVDLEIKNGKITFFEDTNDKPNPKMVGKTVPKPPKELESFFDKRIFVGICVFYVKQRD